MQKFKYGNQWVSGEFANKHIKWEKGVNVSEKEREEQEEKEKEYDLRVEFLKSKNHYDSKWSVSKVIKESDVFWYNDVQKERTEQNEEIKKRIEYLKNIWEKVDGRRWEKKVIEVSEEMGYKD